MDMEIHAADRCAVNHIYVSNLAWSEPSLPTEAMETLDILLPICIDEGVQFAIRYAV
jgi:hypothetical protein